MKPGGARSGSHHDPWKEPVSPWALDSGMQQEDIQVDDCWEPFLDRLHRHCRQMCCGRWDTQVCTADQGLGQSASREAACSVPYAMKLRTSENPFLLLTRAEQPCFQWCVNLPVSSVLCQGLSLISCFCGSLRGIEIKKDYFSQYDCLLFSLFGIRC